MWEFGKIVTTSFDTSNFDLWVDVIRNLTVAFLLAVLQARNANVENGNGELESLPSYTIVSGLPSYAEALEQLKKVKEQSAPRIDGAGPWTPHTPPTPSPMSRLSVAELFQIYKTPNLNLAVKN
ncbi:uncharacterized protein LOC116170645 [Photinus pyralis]|uniref:uncharacterized protein LOC116170645 n=1 Tax=Photinus pyralis TaxID=7054 RepID=UPI001266EA19|nr:uncharacterized protein LOC116170645 [Photinus pyralis]